MRAVAVWLTLMFWVGCSIGAQAADRGYFNCLRKTMSVEQKKEISDWFSSPGVKDCCDLSDGMPGFAEDRDDGIYIAPHDVTLRLAEACRDNPDEAIVAPPADHSNWVKVRDGVLRRTNNPVGFVVVWWLASWDPNTMRWDARCVVDLIRS